MSQTLTSSPSPIRSARVASAALGSRRRGCPRHLQSCTPHPLLVFLWAITVEFLEHQRKVVLVLEAQLTRRLLRIASSLQVGPRAAHPFLKHPTARVSAFGFVKEPPQGRHGNATVLCQRGNAPSGFRRAFRPVFSPLPSSFHSFPLPFSARPRCFPWSNADRCAWSFAAMPRHGYPLVDRDTGGLLLSTTEKIQKPYRKSSTILAGPFFPILRALETAPAAAPSPSALTLTANRRSSFLTVTLAHFAFAISTFRIYVQCAFFRICEYYELELA